MAQNYDLTQTGPELQARIDQVYPNREAIEQETETREAQDVTLETSLKAYTDTEQARAEAAEAQLQSNIDTEQARAETAEGALDTRVSTNEVDIDLLKSQYEALTQSDIIVGPLPSTGQPNKIYRVPGSTYYTDYMWANGGWVKLAEYSTLDGYVYKGIATPSGTPVQAGEAIFYFAVQPGTYTNYGGLVVTNTIAMLKYNGTEWTKDDLITIDDEPTAGSENLVKSGGVADACQVPVSKIGFDYRNLSSNFVYGTSISITTNGWSYVSSAGRTSTPSGTTLHLPKGTIIKLDIQSTAIQGFKVGYKIGEQYYAPQGNSWVKEYTTPVEADYVICINDFYSLDAAMAVLSIQTPGSLYNELIPLIAKEDNVENELELNSPIPISYDNGGFTDGFINTNVDVLDLSTASAPTAWSHAIIDCSEGDYFLVNVKGQLPSACGWVFIDSNNRKIEQADVADVSNVVIVAPKDAVKLVLNNIMTAIDRVSYRNLTFKQRTDYHINIVDAMVNSDFPFKEVTPISVAHGDFQNGFINTNNNPLDLSNPSAPTSGWKYAVINCSEGDYFLLNVVGNPNSARAWCFVDSDNYQLKKAVETDITNTVVIAPKNAAKLILNCDASAQDRVSYKGVSFFQKADYWFKELETDSESTDAPVDVWIDFTVPVNQYIPNLSNTDNTTNDNENTMVDVECILKLPANYSTTGKPCKLLMICHGAGDPVSFWKTYSNYNSLVQKFVDAGYAVFDCNGYSNETNGYNYWGAPRGVEGYYKAYDYVVKNYNVEKEFSIYAFSMGGLTALGLASRIKPNIKCIGMAAPITDLKDAWQTSSRHTVIASAYGFSQTDTYEEAKTIGCDPTLGIVTIGSNEYIFNIRIPIKIWFGTEDMAASITCAQRLVNAINNANGIAYMRTVTGTGHEICYANDNVNTELLYWINRFN